MAHPINIQETFMHFGYIKLFRQFINTSFFKNSKMVQFAIYCLIKANHKEQYVFVNGENIKISNGQFLTGYSTVYKETGLNRQGYRTCLKNLKKCDFLTTNPTNKYTIITLKNWDKYQTCEIVNHQTNHELTTGQPPTNHEMTTNNNDKNDKNDKKIYFTGDVLKISLKANGKFSDLYKFVDIHSEYVKMDAWLVCNPKKRYKNYDSFANNWLRRSNEKEAEVVNAESKPYIP